MKNKKNEGTVFQTQKYSSSTKNYSFILNSERFRLTV